MTRVKICGLTNVEDAVVAAEAGADLLGFIFYEKSPRAVTRQMVAVITETLRSLEVMRLPLCVGVFVSPTVDEVVDTLNDCKLQGAQVNRAKVSMIRQMQAMTGGAAYAAIQPQTYDESVPFIDPAQGTTSNIAPWLPRLLLDAYHPQLSGGTGLRIDSALVEQFTCSVPNLMLAGGLTPDNVAETIRQVRPWAVDVCSGVEAAPGKKDHGKVKAFIQAVRDVDKELTQ